jgi:hypothetical protein
MLSNSRDPTIQTIQAVWSSSGIIPASARSGEERMIRIIAGLFVAVSLIAVFGNCAVAQPVEVVKEYTLTADDVQTMTDKLGVEILAGFNNVYRCQGFQYQVNYLACAPASVAELAGVMQQFAPKSTLARTMDGVYEIITLDPLLARRVLLSLDDISILEKAKLIPPQLPSDWLVTAEAFTKGQDLDMMNRSHGGGIVEVFNQILRTSAGDRVQVTYFYCNDFEVAKRVFGIRFAASDHPRSVKRIGKLVIDIATSNPQAVEDVMVYFGG